MAQKTIPELNPSTSFGENALFPVDSGIQTFKVTAENVAKNLDKFSGSLGDWIATKTYSINDLVKHDGKIYRSLENGNLNNAVSDTSKWTSSVDFVDLKNGIPGNPQPGNIRIFSHNEGQKLSVLRNGMTTPDCFLPLSQIFALSILTNRVSSSQVTGPAAGRSWQSVVSWGNLFVAAANDSGAAAGKFATSPDGITWTARTAPSTGMFHSLVVGSRNDGMGPIFIAHSYSFPTGGIATSPDGITWTARTPSINSNFFKTVQGGPYGSWCWIAISQSGVMRSTNDGATWTSVNYEVSPGVTLGGAPSGLCYAFDKWWISSAGAPVGTINLISSSDNGVTWNDARVDLGVDIQLRQLFLHYDQNTSQMSMLANVYMTFPTYTGKYTTWKTLDGVNWSMTNSGPTPSDGVEIRAVTGSVIHAEYGSSRSAVSLDGVHYVATSGYDNVTLSYSRPCYNANLGKFLSVRDDGTSRALLSSALFGV